MEDMKKRDKSKWILFIIVILILLGIGIALILQNINNKDKFNTPSANDIPQLPESGSLKSSSFNSQFSNQSISNAPQITGKVTYEIPDAQGKWVVYNSQYYGYNNVWLWNSQGKLSSQKCWSLVGNDWRLINDWCNFDLTNSYIYINGTIYYNNYSEYKKENWTWTNNSWFYTFGGFWLEDKQSNWYYIDSSWVYLEDNWKTQVNNGLQGLWDNYDEEFQILNSGSYWFANPSWIIAKNFWINNQSGSNYITNDTWINLGDTYALYNNSNIYHWNTWYFTAQNNWIWLGNSWQSWGNTWVWKSQTEQYYFNNSLIWVQDSWKVKV